MYTYYNKVEKQEHLLYASEIAYSYGLKTINDKPATSLVSSLLDNYIKEKKLEDKQLYYKTHKGFMTKVYPMSIYSEVMFNLAKTLIKTYQNFDEEGKVFKINVNNKNYSFKIG